MYSKTPPSRIKKRPREDSSSERPRKTPSKAERLEDDDALEEKLFQFRILLPNATTIELKMTEQENDIPIEKFIDVVRQEYYIVVKQRRTTKRRINWDYPDLHFTDAGSNKIKIKVNLFDFKPNKWHFLWLHDGSAEPDAYEGMWDLTPHTDLLRELPDDYTFETALADLIDNSLQALWSNGKGERRLLSVELLPNRIIIFDSGPGMDGADGNLVKWGRLGASMHRSMRGKAIGGKPPYLTPFFGMFGYGGPVATMCLGKRAVVSSKTKSCNKVFTLHLEREALVSATHPENSWRTKGGMRDPSEAEKENAPHGSFTKVEIFEPKVKALDIKHFECKLKDIYFPYIQCDEMSGKTSTPIEFQVNGTDLAEIQGGEVATTNLHSCNGPDFILQLHFRISQDSSSMAAQNKRVFSEANARLKCVYFPIVEGKENIERILEKLEADGCGIKESFESFSRVSVRRLGRLLPDTRWGLLPFMEPKLKKGEKGQILKRNCSRVKCFIDTDSGFNPTPHKTDLAQHHPYTKALKNFGNRPPENEKDVEVEVLRDGKKLTLTELEKQYNAWIALMHGYDEEIDGGLDQPTIIVGSPKNKKLDLTADVLRVHRKIERKGKHWTAGQNIKILKGACSGCHKSNVYATLEFIIIEGLPGDASGECRLICRPLGLPEDRGCRLLDENGNSTIDVCDSMVLPIRVIDSEKCIPVDENEWGKKLEVHNLKLPSSIDLLSDIDCQELEIEGALPTSVQAGDPPPENIIAVIRPKSFDVENSSSRLDQKFIIRDDLDMSLDIKYRAGEESGEFAHIYSTRLSCSPYKGLHGLYLLPLREKKPLLFQKAGSITFSFSLLSPFLKKSREIRLERVVQVRASAEIGRWKVTNLNKDELYTVRVGSFFKPLSIACYDRYNNRGPFATVPKLIIKLRSKGVLLAQLHNMKVDITSDNSIMKIKEVFIKSRGLDAIRPNYDALLDISTVDEAFSVALPCQVIPGTPKRVRVHPPTLRTELVPGQIIEELCIEVFDEYCNHVREDECILLRVDGLSFQDGTGVVHGEGFDCVKKVDANGFVDLSNILKVSKGYDKDVLLCVISKGKVIFKAQFRTKIRELRSVQKVFRNCEAGSVLEDVMFEITDSQGNVDESIHDEEKHGQSHTLTIKSDSFEIDDSVRYSIHNGRCTIRSIPLPLREGIFSISVVHSRYPELKSVIEVHVDNAREENHDSLRNFADTENHVYSDQRPCENDQIILHSPPLKVSQEPPQSSKEHKSFNSFSPVLKTPKEEKSNPQFERSSTLRGQASVSQNLGSITCSASISLKELEDDLVKSGMAVNDHSRKLKRLEDTRALFEQHISELQASIYGDGGNVSNPCDQEITLKLVQSKSESAAAVICRIPVESMPRDVVGVVALLGTVDSIDISRMLAQYLGEDQMMAIVCRNYAAAYNLETNFLRKHATEFGQTINRGYHAVCLEDIRPNFRQKSSAGQLLLHLEAPTLPNGNVPRGFLDYAVNLVSIAESHLQWRTKSGLDLRETLFHRLFGELQVYRDRESMMTAQSCIKDGAVSLDGGIVRGNGLISLGHWEPKILFPVRTKPPSGKNTQRALLLEKRKSELGSIDKHIYKQKKSLQRANERLYMSGEKYNNYISQNGSSVARRLENLY